MLETANHTPPPPSVITEIARAASAKAEIIADGKGVHARSAQQFADKRLRRQSGKAAIRLAQRIVHAALRKVMQFFTQARPGERALYAVANGSSGCGSKIMTTTGRPRLRPSFLQTTA